MALHTCLLAIHVQLCTAKSQYILSTSALECSLLATKGVDLALMLPSLAGDEV